VKHDVYALVLFDLAVIIVAARIGGWVFQKLRQPAVVGEVVAGILLGPTLLGGISDDLFPPETRPLLRMLATLGVVVFMFVVGLEVDRRRLRDHARTAGTVSITGMAVPFVLGVGLAVVLRPSHPEGDDLPFVLFLGTAMAITAFPVLVRILQERDLQNRPLGVLATAAAAVDDVMAWIILALVVSLTTAEGGADLPVTIVLAVAFAAFMIVVVRGRLRRFADLDLSTTLFSAALAAVFVSAFLTATIGIHEIFGAFLFGLVFPRGHLAEQVEQRLSTVALILLPVFFVATGLNVDITGIGVEGAWQLAAIVAVAFAGKFGGAYLGARLHGLRGRDALGVGALMNTRGLAELVVLAVGRDLGVIDDQLFTLLVVMAVVTTVATGPLLDLIRPHPDLGAAADP
jgi:Kef-type K+ transport system membrane component KefB